MLELIHGVDHSENGKGINGGKENNGVIRFKVIRGSIKDQKVGEPDYEYRVFPYFIEGRIITGSSESHKAEATVPGASTGKENAQPD